MNGLLVFALVVAVLLLTGALLALRQEMADRLKAERRADAAGREAVRLQSQVDRLSRRRERTPAPQQPAASWGWDEGGLLPSLREFEAWGRMPCLGDVPAAELVEPGDCS